MNASIGRLGQFQYVILGPERVTEFMTTRLLDLLTRPRGTGELASMVESYEVPRQVSGRHHQHLAG